MLDEDLYSLPEGLAVPAHDGACDHLVGRSMPPIALLRTDGSMVRLDARAPGRTIFPVLPSDRDATQVLAWLRD